MHEFLVTNYRWIPNFNSLILIYIHTYIHIFQSRIFSLLFRFSSLLTTESFCVFNETFLTAAAAVRLSPTSWSSWWMTDKMMHPADVRTDRQKGTSRHIATQPHCHAVAGAHIFPSFPYSPALLLLCVAVIFVTNNYDDVVSACAAGDAAVTACHRAWLNWLIAVHIYIFCSYVVPALCVPFAVLNAGSPMLCYVQRWAKIRIA